MSSRALRRLKQEAPTVEVESSSAEEEKPGFSGGQSRKKVDGFVNPFASVSCVIPNATDEAVPGHIYL